MNLYMVKEGQGWKIVLVVVGVILLIAAVYFTFFFSYKCDDLSCFRAHQEKCAKTKFTNVGEEVVWDYKILGKENGNCEIEVELSELKQGSIKLASLQGKSMICSLPLGNLANPEADISKCHGLLKEELQSTIINNLHAYILDNVGEIGEELNKII